MRTNELKTRLEKLENRLFELNMIDRWTPKVARLVRETEIEIEDIKRELGRQTKFFLLRKDEHMFDCRVRAVNFLTQTVQSMRGHERPRALYEHMFERSVRSTIPKKYFQGIVGTFQQFKIEISTIQLFRKLVFKEQLTGCPGRSAAEKNKEKQK